MNLEQAKQVLETATKYELRDHAFGDCEVVWHYGKNEVATGYFGSTSSVRLNSGQTFVDEEADILRGCFAEEKIDRNDETGPDEFIQGQTMPGLTSEGVLEELTSDVEHRNIFSE